MILCNSKHGCHTSPKTFFQMFTYQLLNILSLVFQVTRSLSRSLIICTFINSSLMSRNRLDLSPLYPPWNPLMAVVLDLGTVVLSIKEVIPTRTSPLYHTACSLRPLINKDNAYCNSLLYSKSVSWSQNPVSIVTQQSTRKWPDVYLTAYLQRIMGNSSYKIKGPRS